MKWSAFFFLMAAVYIAPHLSAEVANVFSVLLICVAVVAMVRGD